MKRKFACRLILAVMATGFLVQARAANWYWYGTDTAAYGGDGPWNNESYVWRSHPNNPVTNWVAGNVALFNGDPGTVTLETNIQISANLSVSTAMTFEGPGSLLISGGTHVSTTTATINCGVVLQANGAIRNNYVINGTISDDGNSRSILHHFDTLTLNGSNTFGGGVSLLSGALVIGHDHALGTGKLLQNYDGAILEAGGGARTVTNSTSWNWNWRLYFRGTNDLTFSTQQTLQGTTTPPGPRFNVMDPRATLAYNGGLVKTPTYDTPMTKEGLGTMVIGNAYNATHGTVVTGGTLIVNCATTVVKNNYGYRVWDGATWVARGSSTSRPRVRPARCIGRARWPPARTGPVRGSARCPSTAPCRWRSMRFLSGTARMGWGTC